MGSASVFENIWCYLGYYHNCGLGIKKELADCVVMCESMRRLLVTLQGKNKPTSLEGKDSLKSPVKNPEISMWNRDSCSNVHRVLRGGEEMEMQTSLNYVVAVCCASPAAGECPLPLRGHVKASVFGGKTEGLRPLNGNDFWLIQVHLAGSMAEAEMEGLASSLGAVWRRPAWPAWGICWSCEGFVAVISQYCALLNAILSFKAVNGLIWGCMFLFPGKNYRQIPAFLTPGQQYLVTVLKSLVVHLFLNMIHVHMYSERSNMGNLKWIQLMQWSKKSN